MSLKTFSVLLSGRCVMLKDANPTSFAIIYIVCGYTDLRYGIDSLAAIIERKYQGSLFGPNTLFLFCGRSATKMKSRLWEREMAFCFFTNVLTAVTLPSPAIQTSFVP